MKDRFVSVMDKVKHTNDAIVLRECGDLLDISKDVLVVLNEEGESCCINN
jgi:hypothetical protein